MDLLRGMEERVYQRRIVETARQKNTLVCLPTGLGKTNIAIMLAALRLSEFPSSHVLILAPTKPLAIQHEKSFRTFLSLPEDEFQLLTGEIASGKRKYLYKKRLLFATPQTIQHDLENGIYEPSDCSLLVIDELHHATGKYAYPYIAQRYLREALHPRILGLTASPGSSTSKIKQITKSTGLEAVEIRTEDDPDVRPYVKTKEVQWVEVNLPESFLAVKTLLEEAHQRRMTRLKGIKTKSQLLDFQRKLQELIRKGNKSAFGLASIVAQAIKAEHAIVLLETQGVPMARNYLLSLREDPSRAAASLLKDPSLAKALFMIDSLAGQGSRHPKMSKLCSIVQQQLAAEPLSKIIIFATYRDTVREVADVLRGVDGVRPIILSGQRDLSQKEQMNIIRAYENEANCLITTSIGEEGLSLESADLAIFYEPVASEIRSIQRRGRVGRTKCGKIIVLVTKGTRDEAFRWASYHKEQKMKSTLQRMQSMEKWRSFTLG